MVKRAKNKLRAPTPTRCPCDSGQPYADCCQPLHRAERTAPSAEALMRARFSAFVVHDDDFLWRTLHPAHDDVAAGREAFSTQLQQTFANLRYQGLRVLDTAEADAHGMARVLFHARAQRARRDCSIVEESCFVQHDGDWRYIAGQTEPASGLSHELQQMRIGHWSCHHHH